jgi:hypothetical protein
MGTDTAPRARDEARQELPGLVAMGEGSLASRQG